MAEWFASGRLVDVILLLTAAEAVGLIIYWQIRRRGVAPRALLPNLLAGAFLLLALRFALGDASWKWCCGSLAAAGVAHLADLRQRWRS